MSGAVIDDLCRLTIVVGPNRADLSVPVQMTISELLPTLLRHVDPGLSTQDGDAAWTLQRVGEEPLDAEGTPESLGLLDGDVLHLRPSTAPMAPMHFDDLIDGVATAIRERPDRWRPAMTKQLYLVLAGVAMAVALLTLLIAGPLLPRVIAAAVMTVLAVGGAVASSRSLGESGAGKVLGLGSIAIAFLGGLMVPSAVSPVARTQAETPGWLGWSIGPVAPANLLAAGAAALFFGVVAAIGVGLVRPAFVGVLATAGGIAFGALLALWFELAAPQAAGVVTVTALVCAVFGPMTAARLVRLRLPLLPETIDHLQENIDPLPGKVVLARATSADQYLNALSVAAGILCSGSALLLAPASGWAPPTLIFLVGAAMLLRSRVLVSAWQRLSAVLPGVVSASVLVLMLVMHVGPWVRTALSAGVLLGTAALLFGARYLPARRLVPFWGRWAEIAESLMAIASIPVLLQVLGVYSWAYGLFG